MDVYDLIHFKKEIKAYSKKIGIDKIGFTTAEPFVELKGYLKESQDKGYASGFEKGTIEERTEPKRLLEGAESIISIALAYPSKIENPPRSTKEGRRGIFCRASWGDDYHYVLQNRLEKLVEFIKERIPYLSYKIMVDTGELSDRAVAIRAGVGFSGKNTMLITKEFGSFVYLGEVITNIPFTPDNPIEDGCGDCTICMTACPTSALVQPGQLNSQRCLAFQTQQKHFLEDEFKEKIGTRVYGCDTCQAVCPWNKQVDFHLHEEFEPDGEIAKPLLKPMLAMSNREFRDSFGHISGFWRGKNPLQRNAIIGLAHYKDETAIDQLIEIMKKDVRPAIRGTAAWALGKIGTARAFAVIEEALAREKDESTIKEMEKGLSFKEEEKI